MEPPFDLQAKLKRQSREFTRFTRLRLASVFSMPGGFVVLGDIQLKLWLGNVWSSLGGCLDFA